MLRRCLYRFYRWLSKANLWLRRRFTPAGFLALWGIVISGVIGVDTNFTIAYQVFWFLVCLLGLSLLWGLAAGGRFSAARQLPKFGTVGLRLSYGVELRNETAREARDLELSEASADGWPTLEQFLNTPEPGEEKRNWFDRWGGHYRWRWLLKKAARFEDSATAVGTVPARGLARVERSVVPTRRGVLQFPELGVAWADPFGLVRAWRRVRAPQSVLILPKRFPVRPLNLPGTVKYQPGGVTLASSVGQSEEFVSLREYRAGDPLRHIHWRSWAKMEKPIVKEFSDEFFVRHALVLDTFAGAAQEEVFEDAVSVAASFACTIPDQESLLDLMFVGPDAYCFTSGRGVAPPERMLEILAAVSPCATQPFAALEGLLLRHVAQVTSCVCVFLKWDPPRQALVQRLRYLSVPVQVYVVRTAQEAREGLDATAVADCPDCLHSIVAGRNQQEFACQ